MISYLQDLYRFLPTPGIEMANVLFANDEVVWDSWRCVDEEKFLRLRHTNEVIGAFVTAGEHLHLYTYLDRL
jgi:hypothetical protein